MVTKIRAGVFFVLLMPCVCFGQTYVWTGATNTAWTTTTNWTPAADPNSATDSASLSTVSPANIHPTLSGVTRSIGSIDFSAPDYILILESELDLYGNITTPSGGNISIEGGALFCKSSCTLATSLSTVNTGGSIIFDASATSSIIHGSVTGTGLLQVYGGATLTLVGVKTYSGTTTVGSGSSSAGTLNLGDGSSTTLAFTNSDIALTNNSANKVNFNLASTASFTFSKVISGSSGVVEFQSGNFTLTGANTFSGTTKIGNSDGSTSAGVIIGDGSVSVTSTFSNFEIQNNSSNGLKFDLPSSGTFTYPGVISGTGTSGIVAFKRGTFTLTGNNSFAGTTEIGESGSFAATVKIGDGVTTPTSTFSHFQFQNNSADTLEFNLPNSGTLTYPGVISGTSVVTAETLEFQQGTFILTGNNSFAGTTNIGKTGGATAAVVKIGDGVTTLTSTFAGPITFQNNASNSLQFNLPVANSLTYSNVISSAAAGIGAVSVVQGTVILTGANTFTGTTTVSGGTLQIGAGGSTGSYTGNIAITGGSIIFNRSNSSSYPGIISGTTGTVEFQQGSFTLTGSNSYSGTTKIGKTSNSTAATLQIGDGSTTLTSTFSGPIQFQNNAANALQFNLPSAGTLTYGGVISGTGTSQTVEFQQGTFTLTGNNSFAGTTKIGSSTGSTAAIVNIGDGLTPITSTFSNFQIQNRPSDALYFNLPSNGTLSYGGVISGTTNGTSEILEFQQGTFTLTGNNSFAGTTNIGKTGGGTSAVVKIGDGLTTITSTFAGPIQFQNNASNSLQFNLPVANSLTCSGVISSVMGGIGSMSVVQGTLILTGESTFTGATTVSGGALQIGAGGSAGSYTGNIAITGGSLVFNRSDSSVYPGIISGTTGTVEFQQGSFTLTGSNSYSGTTKIGKTGNTTAATLQIGDGSTTLTSTFSNFQFQNNAANALQFDLPSADTLTYAGVISGTGTSQTVEFQRGTYVLTGDNTFTGATTLFAGTLQIGSGGAQGSYQGDIAITGGGSLIFDRSDTLIYDGVMSDDDGTVTVSQGTLILTGENTFTGTTTVSSGGTLQIGNGGSVGSYLGDISLNSANLVFNRTGTSSYPGDITISGTAGLTKQGTGTVILNGSSTLTTTTISGGVLEIGDVTNDTATLSSSITVSSSGALAGYGTVGDGSDSAVINSGTVEPGGSIGTLTVNGDYTQSANGDLTIEVDSSGNTDVLQVLGEAHLDGTLTIDASGGFQLDESYVFLTATNGVFNEFSNTTEEGVLTQGFLIGTVTYDTNSVSIVLEFNPALIDLAQTPNQKSVATYLLTAPDILAVTEFFGSITQDPFDVVADEFSGATYANQQLELAQISDRLIRNIADRFSPTCDEPAVKNFSRHSKEHRCVTCSRKETVWMTASTGTDQLESESVSGLTTTVENINLGFDMPVGDKIMLGAGLGYSHAQGVATVREQANDQLDLFQGALYGQYQTSNWFLGASLTFGATGFIKTHRFIEDFETSSSYQATVAGQQLRFGYRFEDGTGDEVTPFVGGMNQQIHFPDFTESGDASVQLRLNQTTYHSLRSQMGVEMSRDMLLHPFVAGIWEHEFLDNKGNFDASSAPTSGVPTFYIVGQSRQRDVFVVQGGFRFVQIKQLHLGAYYEGQFAHNWASNTGNVALSVSF